MNLSGNSFKKMRLANNPLTIENVSNHTNPDKDSLFEIFGVERFDSSQ